MSLFAAIAQLLTLQTFNFQMEPSQTSVSLGVVLIWTGTSYIGIVACSRNWYRLALQAHIKKARPNILARYQHWGMEKEVLSDPSLPLLIIATLWASFTIWFIIWFIAPATTPVAVEPKAILLPLILFSLVPVSWGMSDYRHGETKRGKLDALRPTFHNRFSVSEILSMYECLRWAPPVFWDEYTELPEAQINKATNQEFRNRASSFHLLNNQIHQRMALTIAVIAVAAAAPSLAFLFLEGTLTQWLRDLFTVPAPP